MSDRRTRDTTRVFDRIIEALFIVGALVALISFLAAGAAVMMEPDPAEVEHAVKWLGAAMFGGLGLIAVAFIAELIKETLLADSELEVIPVPESADE